MSHTPEIASAFSFFNRLYEQNTEIMKEILHAIKISNKPEFIKLSLEKDIAMVNINRISYITNAQKGAWVMFSGGVSDEVLAIRVKEPPEYIMQMIKGA